MKNIVIFGSTGSIGTSTLDVIRLHKNSYNIFALTGHRNVELLFQQCLEFKPKYAFIEDNNLANILKLKLTENKVKTEVLHDKSDLAYLAQHCEVDIVMSAIVGSAGLVPTYEAAKHGKRILLANKESLVAGGKIITDTVEANNAKLIPVDSEHSAIFQSLPFEYNSLDEIGVNRILLTASGGPFLNLSYAELENVTAAQAIKHPNWSMGQKISVDSSTLMNKGLEIIEAFWLFKSTVEQIEVVVHPQSIIHSMVEYIDSSIIAQLGSPDMKTPIAYALNAPQRIESGSAKLDFMQLNALTFCAPDYIRFPCLQLAIESLKYGGNACAILNAANEVAVAKFLAGTHKFYDIPKLINRALEKFSGAGAKSISDIVALDTEVKHFCLSN